jgi:hypothetical protein
LRAFDSAAGSRRERSPAREREIDDRRRSSAAVSRTPPNALAQTKRQPTEGRIDTLVNNAQVLEQQLAQIEHREPRILEWTYDGRHQSSIQLS